MREPTTLPTLHQALGSSAANEITRVWLRKHHPTVSEQVESLIRGSKARTAILKEHSPGLDGVHAALGSIEEAKRHGITGKTLRNLNALLADHGLQPLQPHPLARFLSKQTFRALANARVFGQAPILPFELTRVHLERLAEHYSPDSLASIKGMGKTRLAELQRLLESQSVRLRDFSYADAISNRDFNTLSRAGLLPQTIYHHELRREHFEQLAQTLSEERVERDFAARRGIMRLAQSVLRNAREHGLAF